MLTFDGLKLVQISDVHLGNLSNAEAYLTKVADSINAEQPDLILLTGDLVNLTGNEGDGLDAPFLKLHATLGKYAILGNHDYGDYISMGWGRWAQATLLTLMTSLGIMLAIGLLGVKGW
jgi:predicted MPP superfamily phosphohydrolase